MVMLLMFSVAVPVLVRVAFLTALVAPTASLPKLMLAVDSVTCCARCGDSQQQECQSDG